jgi:L-ascorbate oxidase
MEYERAQEMVLINGKGGGIVSSNGSRCDDELSVIDVEPGKTYRVRLIGGTGLSFDILAIEGHETLHVIEADGYVSSVYHVCQWN